MKLKKIWALKKKKKQANPIECPKPELISQTCKLLNSIPELNQEFQFSNILMLKNKYIKNIILKLNENEIVKKKISILKIISNKR